MTCPTFNSCRVVPFPSQYSAWDINHFLYGCWFSGLTFWSLTLPLKPSSVLSPCIVFLDNKPYVVTVVLVIIISEWEREKETLCPGPFCLHLSVELQLVAPNCLTVSFESGENGTIANGNYRLCGIRVVSRIRPQSYASPYCFSHTSYRSSKGIQTFCVFVLSLSPEYPDGLSSLDPNSRLSITNCISFKSGVVVHFKNRKCVCEWERSDSPY